MIEKNIEFMNTPEGDDFGFIENNLIILTKYTIDNFLKEDNPAELIGLYTFYYYTAKWQKTNLPKCTTGYVAKGLKWSEDKVRKIKKGLIDLGFITDFTRKNEQGKILGHYIKMNYIIKQSTITPYIEKTTLNKTQGVENSDTNALSVFNLNALSINNEISKSHCNSNELPIEIKKPKKQPKLYYEKYTGKQMQELFLGIYKRWYNQDMICTNVDWINYWKILDKLIPETKNEYNPPTLIEFIFHYLEETWYYDKNLDLWKTIPTPSKILKMINEILQYLKMSPEEKNNFSNPKKKRY
ncbi:MAG: hypothetical protein WC389_03515 [Lutibacter sp.]|jgi:hypothetical protein